MEPLVAAYASLPVTVPIGNATPSVSLKWQTKFGTAPTAISVSIQGSNDNSSWTTVDTSTSIAGETRTLSAQAYKFFRAIINSITGTSPTGEVILTVTGA